MTTYKKFRWADGEAHPRSYWVYDGQERVGIVTNHINRWWSFPINRWWSLPMGGCKHPTGPFRTRRQAAEALPRGK